MPKYRIPYSTWAGGTITVETDEPADAEAIHELAYEEGPPNLCHQCSGSNMSYPNSSLEVGDDIEFETDDDGTPVIYDEATGKRVKFE